MARKKPQTGSDYLKRHGLRYISVPVPLDLHARLVRLAAAQDPPQRVGPWAATVLTEAAQQAQEKSSENL